MNNLAEQRDPIEIYASLLDRSYDQVERDLKLLSKMKYDPAFFAETCFSKGEGWIYEDCGLAPFHRDIYTLLEEKNEKTLVLVPRGHMKTTLVPKIYVLHQMLFGFCKYAVLLVSTEKNRRGLRWAHLSAISNPVQFEELHYLLPYLFGGTEPILKKNDIELVLNNGSRAEYISMTSEFRGLSSEGRPDLIVMDDIIPQTASFSDKDRERVTNTYYEVIRWLGRAKARHIGTGTILHKDDLWGQIGDNRIGGWSFMRLRAYDPDTHEVLWEDRWSYDDLMKIYQEEYIKAGRGAAWYREMLNDPQDRQTNPFIDMEFETYDPKELGDEWKKYYALVSIDHSQGVARDDFVVMATATDDEDNTYVLDYYADDLTSLEERLNRSVAFVKKYKPQGIIIERTSESLSFIDALSARMREKSLWCPIQDPTPSKFGSKNQRITNWLSPKYIEQKILHPKNNAGLRLENQLRTFDITRKNNRDDIIDALSWAIIFGHKSKPEKKSLRPSGWKGKIWDRIHKGRNKSKANYQIF